LSVCPTCHREFAEEGYCPFDGSSLVERADSAALDGRLRTRAGAPTGNVPAEPSRGRASRGRESRPSLSNTYAIATSGPGTLTGSAVASVLQDVLDRRGPERLVGAELDGRYKIERQVGEGGMGVVYLARHMVIEKAVAIKVLRAEVAADESVVKRFVQEARAASRIGHPNIIDVTDFGTTKDGLTYQVMEYLEGKTLSQLLKETTVLPVQRALAIVAQMARALGAAHDKGIVHRDLKPENVFLLPSRSGDSHNDFVKIVDFGIAKVLPTEANPKEQRLTRVGTVFGTPEYMAPEQAAGRTDVDLRADIYALGTILYEMLVGKVPHRGTSTVNTLAMQMLDEPMPMREARPALEISDDLERVIMRSLAKKRHERFDSMSAFLTAIEEVTSKTELDLSLVMQQEMLSSDLFAETGSQHEFDTVPETDGLQAAPALRSPTSARELAGRAEALDQGPRRRVSRSTDPVFLRSDRSTSSPVYDELTDRATAERPAQGGSHFWLVALALLLVGGSVGAFVWIQKGREDREQVAAMTSDAGPLIEPDTLRIDSSDAAPGTGTADALPTDAGGAVVVDSQRPKPTGGKQVSDSADAAVPRPLPAGELEVTIVTRPRGAQLFIGHSYAGSDGLNLRRDAGATLTVTCQLSGFLDGSVKVSFDGEQEVFLCRLRETRRKKCVEGTKNPFDDCP
jgi:serine/threonine protein kinase